MAMARSWNQLSTTPDPTTTGEFAALEEARLQRQLARLPQDRRPSKKRLDQLLHTTYTGASGGIPGLFAALQALSRQ